MKRNKKVFVFWSEVWVSVGLIMAVMAVIQFLIDNNLQVHLSR
jgi:hypothetical protein